MQYQLVPLEKIDALILDFDGVLTNNFVYIDQNGMESVACSRADGLAFEVLRKLEKPVYILSTEKNPVVEERAKKLKIPALQGVQNKVETLEELVKVNKYNFNKILYMGNDLNDYLVMQMCGYTACPADSHKKIKEISGVVLNSNGGNGAVRELLEDILNIDFIKTLYS